MIWQYVAGMLIVPLLLIGWLLVQHITRNFARSHPEFGEYREEGTGCGKSCSCHGNHCQNKKS